MRSSWRTVRMLAVRATTTSVTRMTAANAPIRRNHRLRNIRFLKRIEAIPNTVYRVDYSWLPCLVFQFAPQILNMLIYGALIAFVGDTLCFFQQLQPAENS